MVYTEHKDLLTLQGTSTSCVNSVIFNVKRGLDVIFHWIDTNAQG